MNLGRPAEDVINAAAGVESTLAARAREPLLRLLTLRWVPLTAAFLSLILSVVAIIASTQQPQVMLILPDTLRVAQGRSTGAAYVYLQPAFVNTAKSDRVEVIRDVRLRVAPVDRSRPPVDFNWREQIKLVGDSTSGGLIYQHEADAVPLVVSPSNAVAPLSLFRAPDGWFFTPGTYSFTLIADRVVVSEPVSGAFSAELSADTVAYLDQPGQDKFVALPTQ